MTRTFSLVALFGVLSCTFSAGLAPAADAKDNAAPLFEEQTLFTSGDDGYSTYRIPAMVVTNQGTVLCFCEARKHGGGDYGDIDIAIRRSTDGGRTFSKMENIADDGARTMGNPCPVVEKGGKIWLPFCRDNQQVLLLGSGDDGKTWNGFPPLDISRQTISPEYYWIGTGPGHGVQLSSGRLIIPCWASRHAGLYSGALSYVFYSDDAGSTWHLGGAVDTADECELVELSDGTLYNSLRVGLPNDPCKGKRGYATSKDGGKTWSPIRYDPHLVSPACQGSVIRFTDPKRHDKSRILLSAPSGSDRANLTVHLSYDECRTWPAAKLVHKGPAAYSDLAIARDQSILLLYEADDYSRITLARFNLEWLTDGKDRIVKRAE
jgi:sialidase-1